MQPPQLLLARAAEVGFGDRKRQAVSLARFAQARREAADVAPVRAREFDVHVAVAVIAPMQVLRVQLDALIQEESLPRFMPLHA